MPVLPNAQNIVINNSHLTDITNNISGPTGKPNPVGRFVYPLTNFQTGIDTLRAKLQILAPHMTLLLVIHPLSVTLELVSSISRISLNGLTLLPVFHLHLFTG